MERESKEKFRFQNQRCMLVYPGVTLDKSSYAIWLNTRIYRQCKDVVPIYRINKSGTYILLDFGKAFQTTKKDIFIPEGILQMSICKITSKTIWNTTLEWFLEENETKPFPNSFLQLQMIAVGIELCIVVDKGERNIIKGRHTILTPTTTTTTSSTTTTTTTISPTTTTITSPSKKCVCGKESEAVCINCDKPYCLKRTCKRLHTLNKCEK